MAQSSSDTLAASSCVPERLLLSGVDPDVIIMCKGQQPVPAHKLLLRLASPVWRDLLDNTTNDSTIPAGDDDPVLIEMIMNLIYPHIAVAGLITWVRECYADDACMLCMVICCENVLGVRYCSPVRSLGSWQGGGGRPLLTAVPEYDMYVLTSHTCVSRSI